MVALRVLIVGGGCAGPSLAFWLAKTGHEVTIVERYADLRATGAQVDVRQQGIEVLRRMGILEAVRNRRADESGMAIIDDKGVLYGEFLANTSGEGAQTATSEYEIMRGDFVRLLYDATKDHVKYVFGKTVESFDQDKSEVVVHFSDGTSDSFDLLVGADGQGSRVRRAILSDKNDDFIRPIGVQIAYWIIPRDKTDSDVRSMYQSPGGRMIWRRSHNAFETQVVLFRKGNERGLARASEEQQKRFWTEDFRNVGWQAPRFLEGLQTSKNFYCNDVVQIKTEKWSEGRVVLVGDAAACASQFTGMGVPTSIVGAYILAGEINRHRGDLQKAMAGYETSMRPFVHEFQRLSPWFVRFTLPETHWGINFVRWTAWFMCLLHIPALLAKLSNSNKGGLQLPIYAEMTKAVSKKT